MKNYDIKTYDEVQNFFEKREFEQEEKDIGEKLPTCCVGNKQVSSDNTRVV